MRLLHIDADSLRPDHLGCYGYPRATSPNIDRLAAEGVRFTNVYVSDAPCLPSRTALWSGRHGFRSGVVGHGGTAAQPFPEGSGRGFNDRFGETGWLAALRRAGYRPVTVSSFADRHSAWHWYAGWLEVHNPGKHGHERADEVCALALRWLARHAREDDWFLHVNFWDAHTPYRTPLEFGHPFQDAPPPDWPSEDARQRGWERPGPHSPQEPHGFGGEDWHRRYPRVPEQLDSSAALRAFVDGYDTGVRYLDAHIGRLLAALAEAGVLDETAVVVSADHGEGLGELNVWGDHHLADHATCRVPLVVRWPGLGGGRVDGALHYQFDWAATVLGLVGAEVPEGWDGRSFAAAFRRGEAAGRPYLVTSQGAWTCQRGVRFGDHLCLSTYHDGYMDLPPLLLFDVAEDPHETRDLAAAHPELVREALALLEAWRAEMMRLSPSDADPLMSVLREGGPHQVRGRLPGYLERLRATGRAAAAERLAAKHPREAT